MGYLDYAIEEALLLNEIRRHASLKVIDTKKTPATWDEHKVSFKEEKEHKINNDK